MNIIKNATDEEFPFPFSLHERVTAILAPFSGMSAIPAEVLAKASERGTAVHSIIECLQNGLPTGEIPEALQGYIDSYKQWAQGKQFIQTPPRFYDDEFMITGECDAITKDGSELTLVDFKTSAAEGKTWKYQGAAYAYMARKYGYNITRIEFVKVSKDGKPAKTYSYESTKFEEFVRLLGVYREFFSGNKADMGDF